MNESRIGISLPPISEIAAVTVVIAVLATAMVPAVISARQQQEDQKEQVTCTSNEKQLGLALLQYTQDYDETMPACYKGAPQTWAGRIMPYIKSTSLFKCPTDPTQPDDKLKPAGAVDSYAINSNLRDNVSDGGQKDGGMKLSDFESPAKTVTLFEIAGARVQLSLSDEGTKKYTKTAPTLMLSPVGDGSGAGPQWGYAGKGTSPITYAVERHRQGSNFAACDGHVIWTVPDLVSTGTDNPSSTGLQGDPPGAAAGTGDSYYRLTFSTK